MSTVREDVGVVDAITRLVAETRSVLECVRTGDFEGLQEAIERREEIIAFLRSRDALANLSTAHRNEVVEALLEVQEMETEVKKVFESEMASDNRAIEDATAKVKALSAYERLVPKPRRFDTHK